MAEANRYEKIIEEIFLTKYEKGAREVQFDRVDIEKVAKELDIKLPNRRVGVSIVLWL